MTIDERRPRCFSSGMWRLLCPCVLALALTGCFDSYGIGGGPSEPGLDGGSTEPDGPTEPGGPGTPGTPGTPGGPGTPPPPVDGGSPPSPPDVGTPLPDPGVPPTPEPVPPDPTTCTVIRPTTARDGCSGGRSFLYLVRRMDVGRERPPGVAPGFDLDGIRSDDTDPWGCFQPDFVSPEGRPGIDNQLGLLAPTLESAIGQDLARVYEDSITTGRLVTLIELRHVDDLFDDDCVDVLVHNGQLVGGRPRLDPDGAPAPGNEVRLVAGTTRRFATGRIDMLNLSAFDGTFPVGAPLFGGKGSSDLSAARLTAFVGPDRLFDAVVGGELSVEEMVGTVTCGGFDLPIDLVRSTLESVADLRADRSGICQSVSATLEFEAAEALWR